MKCPVCKEPDLLMSERQGIEIDYCPQCRGVWLDRGELDKLIERSDSPNASERGTRQHERSRHDDDAQRYRRRKSFLSELFD